MNDINSGASESTIELSEQQLMLIHGGGWLDDAWDWTKEAVSDAGDWIEEAAEDVADFAEDAADVAGDVATWVGDHVDDFERIGNAVTRVIDAGEKIGEYYDKFFG